MQTLSILWLFFNEKDRFLGIHNHIHCSDVRPLQMGCLAVGLWDFDLWSVKYTHIAITPSLTLIQSGSSC